MKWFPLMIDVLKRRTLTLFIFVFLLVATGCRNNKNEKIIGKWQLQSVDINGTVLPKQTIGEWSWKFNKSGEYFSRVANNENKGTYSIKGDSLTLLPTAPSKPKQVLSIVQIDSIQMTLTANDEKNKSKLYFLKQKEKKL